MNVLGSRSKAAILIIPRMILLMAAYWAGFQGLEDRFGRAGLAIGIAASHDVRKWYNPILLAAYSHATTAWTWHPATSALLAASTSILMMIEIYFSLPRANKPDWRLEWISILIFGFMLCLNMAVLAGGFEGIQKSIGLGWAVLALAALMYRFSLGAFGIGACFHATSAWGWNPALAILFAATPNICFLIGCQINPTFFLGPLPFMNRVWRLKRPA